MQFTDFYTQNRQLLAMPSLFMISSRPNFFFALYIQYLERIIRIARVFVGV